MPVSQDLCLYVCLHIFKSKTNVRIINIYKVISCTLFLFYYRGDVYDVVILWDPLCVMLYIVVQ